MALVASVMTLVDSRFFWPLAVKEAISLASVEIVTVSWLLLLEVCVPVHSVNVCKLPGLAVKVTEAPEETLQLCAAAACTVAGFGNSIRKRNP